MFSCEELFVATADGRNFRLLAAFTFTRPSGEVILVPGGSESDGASTPAIMWPTLPPFGTYWKAAFLHDFLYRCSTKPKDECDAILKEAMRALGVGEIDIVTIYEGVVLFGEESFDEDRRQK